jgi:hypothetical protein
MIIRYRNAHLFVFDPHARAVDSLPLRRAVASSEAERKALRKAQPSAKLPPPPGIKETSGQAPLKMPRAHLRRLKLSARVGGLRARAYLLRQGKLRERLWYAAAVPRPPPRIRSLLGKVLKGAGGGPFGRALSAETGRIPLKIEIPRRHHRWHAVLRTLRVSRGQARAGARALRPPKGYRHRNLLGPPRSGSAQSSDVPADALRCGILIVTPVLCAVSPGPVSAHPTLWALYWGTRFKAHTDYVSSINHALENFVGDRFADPNSRSFWGPLSQYGVYQGRFQGYEIVDGNPPDSVGTWNFLDIDALVLSHRFGSDAPDYWWRFGDSDPIFAIFVDESQVNESGWGGYHFFTPTEGVLFPILVHPNLPWLIVKVPNLATLTHERSSPAYRRAVDEATEAASHEFVEAATDPYPFLSWADPLKEPIWERGELADICEEGNSYPWGKAARTAKEGTAYATYWSNGADACVPASQPTAHIAYPAGPGPFTYNWRSPVTFILQAEDLYEGSVPDREIRWISDRDGQIGTGHILNTSSLTAGTHHITAVLVNSTGATTVAGPVTVNIVVQPPSVKISYPADGAGFGDDQTINYRGSAFDSADGDLGPRAVWSVDGHQVGTGAALFPYRIPTEGEHTVTLSATNSGGASASDSIVVHVGPETGKPSVSITEPANEAPFNTGEEITFRATAEGAAPITEYDWSDDIDGVLGTGQTITKVLTGGPCFISFHHVTVTASDELHRSASDTITVQVGSIC